jgi:hypothetical protein
MATRSLTQLLLPTANIRAGVPIEDDRSDTPRSAERIDVLTRVALSATNWPQDMPYFQVFSDGQGQGSNLRPWD